MEDASLVIKQFHPHPLAFLKFYIAGVILIILGFSFSKIIILLGIFALVLVELTRRAETFYVLPEGVERGYHLLSTSKKFIEYSKIQNIEVNQSFLENIFGIGTLNFDTAGSDGIELTFYGAKNPYEIEKVIRQKLNTR